ncbi:MAG: aminodeoxychorismate lyase [Gammaproteobacteria bacterium]|nr:aminodeoxychorismate lyase [Gammaproteobacteria bacterium]
MTRWLLNGIPAESVPAADRGLHYADGLFETIAIRDSRPRFLDAHLKRLARGLRRLGFAAETIGPVEREVLDACAGAGDAVAKLIVTRGAGPRGYRPPRPAEPNRMLGISEAKPPPRDWYESGIATRVCATPVALSPATAGLKTLARVEQVLARAEWDDPGITEGLMLDPLGRIVSGTMTNFFCIRNGRLLTPDLAEAGVAGIMREVVFDQSREAGIDVVETRIELAELKTDDELFVTNSQIGLWPIRRLGEQTYTPGALTRSLMRRLAAVGVKECAV